ncbi:hypothetical protein EJ02DRAFT_120580 [Clathrospora elynae]|uniref:SRP9 domain-containing protein n=1 Tax=Clathrospora elynae TaxID=706981 RepID=A0A6A5SV84_9PLEO|nr:hypothetical protein EJ02DRAFT_120580 [Clathrospora elynae]
MPYFKTSKEWYEQSSLLLKARPTSTRITSKYSVLKPSSSKIKKRQKYDDKKASRPTEAPRATSPHPPPSTQPQPEEVTVTFTLKTYDPDSGTCLQYETNKGNEVSRLVGNLGKLGRCMAGLPEVIVDLSAPAAEAKVDEGGDVNMGGVAAAGKADAKAGGGGGKKKKKGKK